jgi:hypothetical protein
MNELEARKYALIFASVGHDVSKQCEPGIFVSKHLPSLFACPWRITSTPEGFNEGVL